MNPKQIALQAIKYLFSEGEEVFRSFSPLDAGDLVKYTFQKMGYPPSLTSDEDIDHIIQLVTEEINELQNREQQKESGRSSMLKKEAWYIELSKKAETTAIDSPGKGEDYPDKEKSHLPGENELPPLPFRKYPKKIV